MKMLLFLVCLAFVSLPSCTKKTEVPPAVGKVGCKLGESLGNLLAATVSSELACSNLDAVRVDILEVVAKSPVCSTATPTPSAVPLKATAAATPGPVANLLCPPIVDSLVAKAVGTLPGEWSCTGGVPADKLKAALTKSCLSVLPF